MSFFLKKFSNAEELGYWTTQSPNIATTINKDSFDRVSALFLINLTINVYSLKWLSVSLFQIPE